MKLIVNKISKAAFVCLLTAAIFTPISAHARPNFSPDGPTSEVVNKIKLHIFGIVVRADVDRKTIELDTPEGLKTFPVDNVALRVLGKVKRHKGVDLRYRTDEQGRIHTTGIIRRGLFNCECEHLLKRLKKTVSQKRMDALNLI